LDDAYTLIMGTSGCAFRLSWGRGWQLDNVAIHHMCVHPGEPERRACEAVGYAHQWVAKDQLADGEALFRERIAESIRDRGVPILAYGVVGPPEPCLVTGYDDEGDVLVGWSFYQSFPEYSAGLEVEPSGYFRKRNWYPETERLLWIGEKRERPPLGAIDREALAWALRIARTPVVHRDRHNGLAAYNAWAEAVLSTEEFASAGDAAIWERFLVHDDAVETVAEGRWYASHFVRQVAEREPAMADDLETAAALYEDEHDLMWQIWGLVGGNGRSGAHARKFADQEIRERIAPLILMARDKEAEASDYLERALAR
jgi:hypothetical protein